MGNHNSLLTFVSELFTALHADVASSANVPRVELDRDNRKIATRASSEGLSFYTKTLPRMGKAIDKALSSGEQLQCPFFKKRKGTQIPNLFGYLISRVFDSDGWERSDASPAVLGYLRQLLFVFYKLELQYTDETVSKAISQFVEVDDGCSLEIGELDPTSLRILQTTRSLIRKVTHDLDLVNIKPKHGPGVVATGQSGGDKALFTRFVEKLEAVYPLVDYFHYNYSHVTDRLDYLQELPSVLTGTAKLVSVPKDSRGPRLISAEPLENQWIQQGQMANIVSHLQSHPITKGFVNFTNQEVNGRLALEGSETQKWCTLDMKEASDRVSVDLVKYLFHEHTYKHLDASRSTHTKLPDCTVMPLKKFAPMGSAVCFPVEALIFWALSVSSIICKHNVPLGKATRLVYVYGDDIICSSEHHATIREYLPKFGLKLNEGKCCTAGFFRESCGVDAYKGVNVTPTKISSVWSSRLSPDVIASYVSYSNEFWKQGLFNGAKCIEEHLQRLTLNAYLRESEKRRSANIKKQINKPLPGRAIPYSQSSQTGGICFVRPSLYTRGLNTSLKVRTRYNKRLCRSEMFVPTLVGDTNITEVPGWEEMLYCHSGNQSFNALTTAPRYDHLLTFEEQITENNSRVWDSKVFKETLRSLVNPKPEVRAGEYAVRHRNRIQWRWTGSHN